MRVTGSTRDTLREQYNNVQRITRKYDNSSHDANPNWDRVDFTHIESGLFGPDNITVYQRPEDNKYIVKEGKIKKGNAEYQKFWLYEDQGKDVAVAFWDDTNGNHQIDNQERQDFLFAK